LDRTHLRTHTRHQEGGAVPLPAAIKVAQFNSPLLDAMAAKSLFKLVTDAKQHSPGAGQRDGAHALPSPARVAQVRVPQCRGHLLPSLVRF